MANILADQKRLLGSAGFSPASHVPLPWRSGEPRADTGAKGSHVAADATRKNPLSKHAAPHLRAAFCRVQITINWLLTHSHDTSPSSVAACLEDTALLFTRYQPPNSSLPCVEDTMIHMLPAPHQRLPCVEDTLIHMLPAPHQRLPCVEGHSHSHEISHTSAAAMCRGALSFTWYQPHISGCHV